MSVHEPLAVPAELLQPFYIPIPSLCRAVVVPAAFGNIRQGHKQLLEKTKNAQIGPQKPENI